DIEVSDENMATVNVFRRGPSTVQNVPNVAPLLTVQNTQVGSVDLVLREPSTRSRSRPAGASSYELSVQNGSVAAAENDADNGDILGINPSLFTLDTTGYGFSRLRVYARYVDKL